jgi:hypothetical protein
MEVSFGVEGWDPLLKIRLVSHIASSAQHNGR